MIEVRRIGNPAGASQEIAARMAALEQHVRALEQRIAALEATPEKAASTASTAHKRSAAPSKGGK